MPMQPMRWKHLACRLRKDGTWNLVRLVLAGVVAGSAFNLALGAFVLDIQGILGGAVAGLLVHTTAL